MVMSCGIYKITNTINNKAYIGQSLNIEERWKRHKYHCHIIDHYPLYQAFAKYGIDNFNFEIIKECLPEELNSLEMYYINYYDTFKNGYNQTEGGEGTLNLNVKLESDDIEKIYDLLKNSELSQKEISIMFQVGEDTISEINNGKSRYNPNFTYPIRNNKQIKNYCLDCGVEISPNSKRCIKCNAILERKVLRPSKENLEQDLKTLSFVKIGKKYGVTDNAVRKWCKMYNLPYKASQIKEFFD